MGFRLSLMAFKIIIYVTSTLVVSGIGLNSLRKRIYKVTGENSSEGKKTVYL